MEPTQKKWFIDEEGEEEAAVEDVADWQAEDVDGLAPIEAEEENASREP